MPRNPKHQQTTEVSEGENGAGALLAALIDGGADTSRLLELYYWTREPGIVELIRTYLDLPERTQRNLSTFLLNGRTASISSTFDQQGRLVLGRTPTDQNGAASPDRHRQS